MGTKMTQNREEAAEKKNVRIAPTSFYTACFLISLALPNLIFSGGEWYDTLHIIKWAAAMVPIAMIAIVVGIRLLLASSKEIEFHVDPFGWVWFGLLLFLALQPLWTPLTSLGTFFKEWLFFATLFGTYLFSYNYFPEKLHRLVLWGSSLNAALNVIFAEIMVTGQTSPAFFIMNVPGHYIGNTGQQEMFGLWMAMALFNSVYLHLRYSLKDETDTRGRLLVLSNLILMLINSWGLWNSTARGGILSLFVGFIVMVILLARIKEIPALKRAVSVFSVVLLLLLITLGLGAMGVGRSTPLVSKMADMVQNPTAVAQRSTIWQTSIQMIRMHPITGVGLGHYKWNYLDAQRVNMEKDPDFLWQFTYWAHSEYLQWIAETGLVGTLVLFALAIWWLIRFGMCLKKGTPLSLEAIWGCGMLFLIWFDALFSRPFHRIENALWMSVAFAIANREILPKVAFRATVQNPRISKYFGVLLLSISSLGLFFFAGGLLGDQYLLKAMKAEDLASKRYYLGKAEKILMTRDEAFEQGALLTIEEAKARKDAALFSRGLADLYAAFERRPTSTLIFNLYGYAKAGNIDILFNQIAPYLRIRNGIFTNDLDPVSEENATPGE